MKVKMICFDMDGTVADLYGVNGWLEMLRKYDPTPYIEARPMWNMEELATILNCLRIMGVEVRIITWLSKESTKEYDKEVRIAKREWLEQYGFPFDHFHGVAYGTTKANCVRKYLGEGEAILIDDNAKVREGWHLGEAINPTEIDIVEYLKGLLTE